MEDLIGAGLSRLEDRLQDREVRVHVPPDLPPLQADAILLAHALTNVLDNALKYSPPGSPLEIEARVAEGRMLLTVADRGIGIPEDELEAVFAKFHRAEQDGTRSLTAGRTGLGLGLSITRGIVQAHGGRAWAERRPGGGTVIVLSLPLNEVTG